MCATNVVTALSRGGKGPVRRGWRGGGAWLGNDLVELAYEGFDSGTSKGKRGAVHQLSDQCQRKTLCAVPSSFLLD